MYVFEICGIGSSIQRVKNWVGRKKKEKKKEGGHVEKSSNSPFISHLLSDFGFRIFQGKEELSGRVLFLLLFLMVLMFRVLLILLLLSCSQYPTLTEWGQIENRDRESPGESFKGRVHIPRIKFLRSPLIFGKREFGVFGVLDLEFDLLSHFQFPFPDLSLL